jgi:hypothetical protein
MMTKRGSLAVSHYPTIFNDHYEQGPFTKKS